MLAIDHFNFFWVELLDSYSVKHQTQMITINSIIITSSSTHTTMNWSIDRTDNYGFLTASEHNSTSRNMNKHTLFMMDSRCDALSTLNPPQLHAWWRSSNSPNIPDQRIRQAIIAGRRIVVSSRRRGESAPVSSVHHILIRMQCNLNAETAQVWEDHSSMLDNNPPIVDVE